MRGIVLLVIIFLSSGTAIAAENILKTIGKPSGFFLVPEYEGTDYEKLMFDDAEWESLTLRGGIVLTSKIGIGAFLTRGYGPSTSEYGPTVPVFGVVQVTGLTLQYFEDRFWPRSPFSIRGELAAGSGRSEVGSLGSYFDQQQGVMASDNFAVYEATLYPQLELYEPFYFSVGLGYRLVQGFTEGIAENKMLSGFQSSAALTFWLPHF